MDIDCTRCAALIDDLVDGTLDPATARAVEAHCASCAGCGDALAATRVLLAAAAALPKEHEPPVALWSAVAARTVARPRSARAQWFAYAAAATVVAGIGGLVAVELIAPPQRTESASLAPTPPIGAPVYAIANPTMERRAHLVSDGTGDGRRLDPAAMATVERNMKVIHAALAEIEAAVQADPNDPNLRRLLVEIHLQESALIERSQRLSISPNRRTDI
jgi:hypothetical protein